MENYKERREEVEHIADSYGLEAQMRKTVKELSELIQTMSPVRKTEEALIPDSVGDIADVQIMLWQHFLEAIDEKISRTEGNLK